MPLVIDIDPSQPVANWAQKLQLARSPLILLLGNFPPTCSVDVASIFQRAVIPAAIKTGAVVVDDGKRSGCSAAIADAALDYDNPPRLLAIVENERTETDIEPNHDQVIRLAKWAGTPRYKFQIFDQLVNDIAVCILFGGGEEDKRSLLHCARRKWPTIVLTKTGGLSEQLATAKAAQLDGAPVQPADPNLREIMDTAILHFADVNASLDALRQLILAQIDPTTASATLSQAWARFDELDFAALRKQTLFRRIELALIVLAVIAALLAILSNLFQTANAPLHMAVIATPIIISIIGAYNSHFRDGNKWILLRGSAESLKREIFRFRARAGAYSDEQCQETSRESKLAAKLKEILSALEQSEVNKTSLMIAPFTPKLGNVFSRLSLRRKRRPVTKTALVNRDAFLSPDEYIEQRIQDQIGYFVRKTRVLSRKLIFMQLCIYIVGGAGTFLAAIHEDIWVALATAVVTAFATKLQADQTETSLIQYNQTLASLRNVESWWRALTKWEKRQRRNIDTLVDQAEKAMEAETAGWVQQMQSALDKLTEKEQPNPPAGQSVAAGG
jgi:hypothetical protein